MGLLNRKYTKHIGSEIDDELFNIVKEVFENLNAKFLDEKNIRAGSQDIFIATYEIDKKVIKLYKETYRGLSIKGKKKLVNHIIKEIEKKKLSISCETVRQG